MRLKDKVAIVTGAAAGMGKAIAESYAKEGASVAVSDINLKGATKVAEAITAAGGNAFAIKTDVSSLEELTALFEKTTETYGRLDILVNNAGVMDNVDPVGDLTDDKWDFVMNVNAKSVMQATRLAIPIFLEQGNGTIVNNISVGGLYGARAGAAYTASKHAVVGLTKNTGFMYGTKHIRCNGFAPGGVATDIGQSQTNLNEFGTQRQMSGIGSNIRVGESEEVAHLAVFLGSDESSFINGQVIAIDGGWTAY